MDEQQCGTDNLSSSNKLPENLEQAMKSIAKRQRYINYEISTKKISTDGGSYMGILYEIDIKGRKADGDKEIHIFVKNIVENIQMPIYSIPHVFSTEAWCYTDLFKLFTELQDEAKIPDEERLKMAYSFDECNPKSIILEHLGKKGYKMYNRMEPMSLEFTALSVKAIAKLHAMTFVIKEKRSDYFNKHIITKKQPFIFKEEWYAFVKNMADYSINCLEVDVKEKVKDAIENKAADYPRYMEDTSTVCTLCHGDYKLNNIMAKEVNGEITEVIPVDFQILHYGSPILDFVYLIFHGTDREFRKKHLEDLKDLYYKTLASFLKSFEIDIENVFPRTEFEKVYKDKLDFGLMVNVFYAPFLFAMEDEAPDVTKEELSTLNFKVDARFTERFREIVADFMEWGYI